jgi:hypothetical protein
MARANTSVLERAAGAAGDGELLLELGVDVAQSTVAKYMERGRPPPGQNFGRPTSATGIAAMDLLVLPTIGFTPLKCLRAWTRIAGVSSRRQSHPIPPPNGLRGRSPKPFLGKRHRDTAPRPRRRHGHVVRQRLAAMGIHDRPITAWRTPRRLDFAANASIMLSCSAKAICAKFSNSTPIATTV